MNLKLLTILLGALILTACGGSGSDGKGGSVVTKPPFMPSTYTLAMGEVEEQLLEVSVEFDEVRTDMANTVISFSIKEGGLFVKTSEVDKEVMGRADLLFDGIIKGFVVISISNSSAGPILAKAASLVDNKSKLTNQTSLHKAYRYFVDVAYLAEKITDSRKQQLLADFNPITSADYTDSVQALNSLDAALTMYRAGAISSTQIEELTSTAEQTVKLHANNLVPLLNSLESTVEELMPVFPELQLEYRQSLGELTLFKGNPALGSFDDNGAFVFDDRFMILSEFSSKETSSKFCPF